jgi:predicted lipoprotein with Yx(FWY)xxD motif
MRRLALLLPFAAAALIATGCGGDDANGNGSGSNSGGGTARTETGEAIKAEASKRRKGARVKVVDSQYGRVIANGRGEAFYLFDKEKTKKSQCYGACARAWPPVLTRGRPQAGSGAKQRLLGTTRRRNGKLQVTYAGQPLYYYVDDSPGTILCHDVAEFGGLWLVVKPNGRAAS